MASVCGLPFVVMWGIDSVVVIKKSCRRIECSVLHWTCRFVATVRKLLLPYQHSSVDMATLSC